MGFDPDKYLASKSQQGAGGFDPDAYLSAKGAPKAPSEAKGEPYSSSILPLTNDGAGNISFDSNAGILGMAKRAVTAPGQVWRGELDPMSPEGQARATEMALMFAPAGAATRVNGSVFAPKSAYKTITPKAPTREALAKATQDGYDKVSALGVKYKADAVSAWANDLKGTLNEKGYFSELAPKVHTLLDKLADAPPDSYVRMDAMDALRKILGKVGPDATEASAARKAIGAIDDFIGTADSSALVDRAATYGGKGVSAPGQGFSAADAAANQAAARDASNAILEARGNAAAGFRSDKITELEDIMGLRASAANSGMNLDNTSRSKLVSLLTNSGGKGVRGFSPEEKQAITKIITGTKTKNALRRTGNMLGGGGGLGQTLITAGPAATVGMGTGSLTAALLAALPGIVGASAKTASNRMANKEIKALGEMMRARSPLGEQTMIPRQVYDPSVMPGIAGRSLASSLANGAPTPQLTKQQLLEQARMARLTGVMPGPGGYY